MHIGFVRGTYDEQKVFHKELLCERLITYCAMRRLVRAAIRADYEFLHAEHSETRHVMIFFRRKPLADTFITLVVAGTEKEIGDLQKDSIISSRIGRR
ncbi:MAG: hypothetical protein KGI60_04440 [Patescibacteria group bacterium]|nr:hypothetical protein [Patescibacteria group bacterium]